MSSVYFDPTNSFNANNHLVGKGDELDKEAFLLLLVTQFQNQDPLSPSEDTEFVAQLAQFTSLEQMMNLNTSMEALTAEQQKQMIINSASLIGMEVSARGTGISVVDGSTSTVSYASDVDIAVGVANIYDSNGNLIASVGLSPSTAGINTFQWDGKDSEGNVVANGVYTLALSAQDKDGNAVLTDTQITGVVNAVSTYNGEQLMRLDDGRVVSLTEVYEIYDPAKKEDPSIDGDGDRDDGDDGDGDDGDGDDGDPDNPEVEGGDGTDPDGGDTTPDSGDTTPDTADPTAFSLFSRLFNK